MEQAQTEMAIIGAGIAGLTAGALLALDGKKVTVWESNWLPGGCASSYPRKNRIFESGATTLVGLGDRMPLQFVLDRLGIDLGAQKLDLPMQVRLNNGQVVNRYERLEDWIHEAERVFGPDGQRAFWRACHRIARFVWDTSLQQRAFPPKTLADLLFAARHFRPRQLAFAALAFKSTRQLLADFGLEKNPDFVRFVNEQLLITAQNRMEEVNALFGATALCYTNFPNYYLQGGMIRLAEALTEAIRTRGGEVLLRTRARSVKPQKDGYLLQADQGDLLAKRVIFAIPANNVAGMFDSPKAVRRLSGQIMPSEMLRSAFQMGLVYRRRQNFDCVHYQLHLPAPLPVIGAASIFLSLSHPGDLLRCGPDEVVASVSTHIFDPARTRIAEKTVIETAVVQALEDFGFFPKDDLLFSHSSTPGSWQKWTHREWGFVGGYPQYLRIKPWQMLEARLDGRGAYLCGDSAYPGQGIPGACLSGIIAWQKIRLDEPIKLPRF